MEKKLGITELVLRDGHQSLLATRMRIEDMLPIAEKLDQVGFWSIESWGGATFDACIRYLGEDPWERIRELKKAMPNTPQQMLLRAQNLLGYRHYADDVVEKFVERSAANGVDIFRVFDAMNDMRNLNTAIKATVEVGKHAQGTISYTVSPVHTIDLWVDLGKQIEDMGAHSLCIKDMAGLLKPYTAYELVSRLKATLDIPIHMQCHATTGMSTATYIKSVEAGIDNLDTSISSMSMTYGHSATESMVAMLEEHERATGLDIALLEDIAAYFRVVRKKYSKFEGSLKGVDSRILVAQVPGGMLTNLENQLREQNASDRLDEVLGEIPKVREELGYIPLVTPTSQIVGSQAVINVLMGERYKNITKETAGVLKGEYGLTPAPLDSDLQSRVLEDEPITCRPADLLDPELDNLKAELRQLAQEKGFTLSNNAVDDVLTYALFPQVGLSFLENRGDASFFEPEPGTETNEVDNGSIALAKTQEFEVTKDSKTNNLRKPNQKDDDAVQTPLKEHEEKPVKVLSGGEVERVSSTLAGNVVAILLSVGSSVDEGQPVIVLESMKMETEVCAPRGGSIARLFVEKGDAVEADDLLFSVE